MADTRGPYRASGEIAELPVFDILSVISMIGLMLTIAARFAH
jgi:hypothetical protein